MDQGRDLYRRFMLDGGDELSCHWRKGYRATRVTGDMATYLFMDCRVYWVSVSDRQRCYEWMNLCWEGRRVRIAIDHIKERFAIRGDDHALVEAKLRGILE